LALGKSIERTNPDKPEDNGVQLFPPLVVLAKKPFMPPINPVFASTKCRLVRYDVVPVYKDTQPACEYSFEENIIKNKKDRKIVVNFLAFMR